VTQEVLVLLDLGVLLGHRVKLELQDYKEQVDYLELLEQLDLQG